MAESTCAPSSYDRIAHLYDVDMARNMAFDDVGFYVRVSSECGRSVLEMGCGSGRVLLALQSAGLVAVGIDASEGMLRQLAAAAAARGLPLRACRMDVRRLAFGTCFDTVLCPYSLITYMVRDGDAARLIEQCRSVLAPGGAIIVDAFVPRPIAGTDTFVRDYARPYRDGMLIRSKRVTALSPQTNRIERRYEVTGSDGDVREVIETSENIRPFSPDDLLALLASCGFREREIWWNYTSTAQPADAQFFTIVAGLRS
jgi:SAM-dependent methyltransferase